MHKFKIFSFRKDGSIDNTTEEEHEGLENTTETEFSSQNTEVHKSNVLEYLRNVFSNAYGAIQRRFQSNKTPKSTRSFYAGYGAKHSGKHTEIPKGSSRSELINYAADQSEKIKKENRKAEETYRRSLKWHLTKH